MCLAKADSSITHDVISQRREAGKVASISRKEKLTPIILCEFGNGEQIVFKGRNIEHPTKLKLRTKDNSATTSDGGGLPIGKGNFGVIWWGLCLGMEGKVTSHMVRCTRVKYPRGV